MTKYNDTWSYDYNNNTWKGMNPIKRPPALTSVSMAYDSESDRVILFGGYNGASFLNETWAYDYKNNTWTDMKPSKSPSVRYANPMEYDSKNDRVILFGGADVSKNLNDTWAYDYNSDTWTNMVSIVGPSIRHASLMGYDSHSGRIVLFGGCISIASNQYFDDTWTYDYKNNTWKNVTAGTKPSARIGSGFAYYEQSDRIVLFGGYGKTGGNDETWTFDLDNKLWQLESPTVKPSARWSAALAYDSESGVMIFFGGYDFSAKGDTWAYTMEKYPSVVFMDPANGSMGIPPNTNISITFNQAMNESFTQTAISSSPTITGSFSWYPGEATVKWDPDGVLKFGTKYIVTITTNAKSKLGINLPNAYVFSFNTSQPAPDIYPPYVVSTSPANGSVNISVTTNITIQWNESMNQASADGAFSSSPAIICAWSWSGVNQTCTPGSLLKLNTKYTITIASTAKDLAGNYMKSAYTYSFTTESIGKPPVVVSTSPKDGETNVSLDSAFGISFSEGMDALATEGATSSSPNIPGVFFWGSDNRMSLVPTAYLLSYTTYTITVTTAAKSMVNVNMANPYTFSFTTGNWIGPKLPKVTVTNPANGAMDVSLNTKISITFNKAMNKDATGAAITSTPTFNWTATWSSWDYEITLAHAENLHASKQYTITVSINAKSFDGANLASPYSFHFTTLTPPDTTPPTVTSTYPSNDQTDVDRSTKISITFSEPMNTSATGNAVSILPGTITDKIWSNDSKTLTLTATLDDGKTYSVSITFDAKDVAGNAMTHSYTFSFTTKSSTGGLGNVTMLLGLTTLIVIIAILLVLALLLLRKKKERCPECAEPIPKGAILCPHCGYDFIRRTRRSITEGERTEGPQPKAAGVEAKKAIEVDEGPAVKKKEAIDKIKRRRERAGK